jgi:hypothetical protein
MAKLSRYMSALGIVAVGLFATNANAAPLGLSSSRPDVLSNFISESYNATTKTLTATGTATQLTTPPNSISTITNGSFTLSATFSITGSGSTEVLTPTSGSLSVTGAGGTHNYFSSTVLQNFGFSTNSIGSSGITNQFFEFVFGPGTGDFGVGNKIDVILASQINAPYATSFFDSNFNNSGQTLAATADTFVAAVPLPNAAYMGLAGLALVPLFLLRRRHTA